MGALSAFLGGAGGAGLIDLSRKMDRRAEIEQQQQLRQEELERQRQFQLERDQQSGFGARGRRSGGGGGDDVGGDPMEARRQAAAFELMQREKIPMAQALSLVDASISGENPLTRTVQRTESFDDGDRQRNVTTEASEPDIERFKAIVAQVGAAFSNADSNAKSNAEQRAKGRQLDFQTDSGREAQGAPQERVGALAQGVRVAGGNDLFKDGDNVSTGELGALSKAKVGTEGTKQMSDRAQASKYVADANKLKADVAGDLKSQTPERLTTTLNAINGLIRTYDENSMDDAARAARAELQGMAREIANELKRKGLSGGALPAAKPAEPPKAGAKLEPAPRDPAQRKAGVTYETPRGPLKWTGTGWVKG